MRTYLSFASATAIALTAFWPQFAVGAGAYSYGSTPKSRSQQEALDPATQDRIQKRHDALMALRAEGLRLRDADGGKLTPEHEAYLQAKLDAINADGTVKADKQ